jgi:parallel beta-helix repeat protein
MRNIRIAPPEERRSVLAGPTTRAAPGRSRLRNWFATVPILFLVPALLYPLLTASAANRAYASDTFGRQVTAGWGSSEIGGAYALLGSAQDYGVATARGAIAFGAPGVTRAASLGAVSADDVDLSFGVASDKVATGGGQYVYGVARQVSPGNEYRAKMRIANTGAVYVQVNRVAGGVETSLGRETRIAGLVQAAGVPITLRFQVLGKNPTTLRINAWAAGQPEPAVWAYATTDATPLLQAAGGVGVRGYLSASSSNAPVRLSFDDFVVSNAAVAPVATPTPTPAPVATPTPTALSPNAVFVSPSGNDSNAGTSAAPWLTLQKAANTVTAGTTVYVRAGTYAGFAMSRSGTASAPIVFTGYPGDARPTIAGDGVKVDVVRMSGNHDVSLDGFIIQGSAGIGDQGAGVRTENAAYNIRITKNLIRNNNAYGINLSNSTYVTVDGNEITGNEEGVIVNRAGEGTLITNNQVHDNNRMIINTVSPTNDDHGAVGIAFLRTTGHVVASGNRIWKNRAASYDYGWDGGAFEIYAASNVTMTDNLTWDNENVLETGTDGTAPCNGISFARNVSYGAASGTSGERSFGMFLRCASGSIVANNTFYDLDAFVFSVSNNSGTFGASIDGLQIVNNVAVMASGKIYGIDTAVPATVVIDHNDVYNPNGYVASVTGHGNTTSLAQFSTWTGFDSTGISTDPRFVNASLHDFTLNAGSPAIDRGIAVPGITSPFAGAAPDMGRFEYGL